MKEFLVRPGTSVRLPDGLALPTQPSAGVRRRRRGLTTGEETASEDPVITVLQNQEFILDGGRPVVLPTIPAAPRRRTGPEDAVAPEARLTIELSEAEQAVILVERDGFYEWLSPKSVEYVPSSRPTAPRRGRSSLAPTRQVRQAQFVVALSSAPATGAVTQGPAKRGVISDALTKKAVDFLKAYVLKFAANVAASAMAKFLERKVQRGLVRITSPRPQEWQRVEDFTELGLPKDRRARVLLFIHGTFSSTAGSYGALGATPWGQAFLEGALASYDAVVGFDHATLGDDPRENANDLWRRLKTEAFPLPPALDVIAFSRGGLVFRYFAEELLPRLTPAPMLDRTVFVGCTLSGTELASPQNWEQLLALYTNLAAGLARALGKLPSPSTKTISAVLGGGYSGVGCVCQIPRGGGCH